VSASPSNGIEALGIAGSLRQGSYDRALLRAAQDLAPDGLDIAVFHNETLNRIPPAQRRRAGWRRSRAGEGAQRWRRWLNGLKG
jgi:NAD(P)H-dependent FMN reductase